MKYEERPRGGETIAYVRRRAYSAVGSADRQQVGYGEAYPTDSWVRQSLPDGLKCARVRMRATHHEVHMEV